MYGLASAVLLVLVVSAAASSLLISGGTIIAFDNSTQELQVIRNGSLLVQGDHIEGVWDSTPSGLPNNTDTLDATGKIITPGFIDCHKHGWQTAYKTIASNSSLVEYLLRYGEFASEGLWNADDVYIGQLAGQLEGLNAGVTTTLDHAHHTWSDETAEAGLQASIDGGGRVFWAFAFHDLVNWTKEEQFAKFREMAGKGQFKGTPTSLSIAYDALGPDPNVTEVHRVFDLIQEFDIPVLTAHSLQGPWGATNSPEDLHFLGYLNSSTAIVLSHASFMTAQGAALIRSANQYVAITPESEMHWGHTHPKSHLFLDQAALGVDTHFTYSTDILTQARIWLQQVRYTQYSDVVERWKLAGNNPMSVNQAFLLATRHGGLALKREDLGVIQVGAKADIVVWDAESPSMLGWVDPVAAVILHASVGDIEAVLVDGKFVKKDRKLIMAKGTYADVKSRFLESARRIQAIWKDLPAPDDSKAGLPYPVTSADTVDSLRGDGDGYGRVFV